MTAYFDSSGLIDLAKKSTIKKAILENHVELTNRETKIYTNIVSYSKNKDIYHQIVRFQSIVAKGNFMEKMDFDIKYLMNFWN